MVLRNRDGRQVCSHTCLLLFFIMIEQIIKKLHAFIRVCKHLCIHTFMRVRKYLCIHNIHTYIWTHTHSRTHTHTQRTHMYTYAYTYIHGNCCILDCLPQHFFIVFPCRNFFFFFLPLSCFPCDFCFSILQISTYFPGFDFFHLFCYPLRYRPDTQSPSPSRPTPCPPLTPLPPSPAHTPTHPPPRTHRVWCPLCRLVAVIWRRRRRRRSRRRRRRRRRRWRRMGRRRHGCLR